MNPIRLLLVHLDNWYRQEPRIDGQFAYPVPGLTWTHCNVPKSFTVDLNALDCDLVWWDDGRYHRPIFIPGRSARRVPVVFWAIYPTIADHIARSRMEWCREHADLALIDHDSLDRWQAALGPVPVRRLAYSVNERFYRDRGYRRDIDVGFYCVWKHNPGRPALHDWLESFCRRKGYRYVTTHGQNVGPAYADLLARTRVVVHLARSPHTRPARIFDVAACGAALLASRIPPVDGEWWEDRVHYVAFDRPTDRYQENAPPREPFTDADCEQLAAGLEYLLDEGHWQRIAETARQYVLACHTWERRSWQLRGILLDTFSFLRSRVGEEWPYAAV